VVTELHGSMPLLSSSPVDYYFETHHASKCHVIGNILGNILIKVQQSTIKSSTWKSPYFYPIYFIYTEGWDFGFIMSIHKFTDNTLQW